MMTDLELAKYVAEARNRGTSDQQIREELLKVGWNADIINNIVGATIPNKNDHQIPPIPSTTTHFFLKSFLVYFFAFLVFFGVVMLLNQLTGSPLNGTARTINSSHIIGFTFFSIVGGLFFAFLHFLYRKIRPKKDTEISTTKKSHGILKFLGVLGILLLILGSVIAVRYFSQKKGYVYTTPGTISVLDHKISLDECISTNDETTKKACAMNYAVQLKDPSLCRKIHGESLAAYYCEYSYMGETNNWYPTDIKLCHSMSNDADSIFYKDNCFRGIAEVNFDSDICKYLSVGKDACVIQVNNNAYAKKNLCSLLFKNNQPPGATDCREYVNSLHNIATCKLLTRAQGPVPEIINDCIKSAGGTSKDYVTSSNVNSAPISTAPSNNIPAGSNIKDCGSANYASNEEQSKTISNSTCFNQALASCNLAVISGVDSGLTTTFEIVGKEGGQCVVTQKFSGSGSYGGMRCLVSPTGGLPSVNPSSCTEL